MDFFGCVDRSRGGFCIGFLHFFVERNDVAVVTSQRRLLFGTPPVLWAFQQTRHFSFQELRSFAQFAMCVCQLLELFLSRPRLHHCLRAASYGGRKLRLEFEFLLQSSRSGLDPWIHFYEESGRVNLAIGSQTEGVLSRQSVRPEWISRRSVRCSSDWIFMLS